jgi:hypothetical protein
MPDVLADQDANIDTMNSNDKGLISWNKIAILVKDAKVGQVGFDVTSLYLTAMNDGGNILRSTICCLIEIPNYCNEITLALLGYCPRKISDRRLAGVTKRCAQG